MARFVVNEPIVSAEPTIGVDAGLPVGRHRFRLEVIGASGRRSAPDEAIVEVRQIVIPRVDPTSISEPHRPRARGRRQPREGSAPREGRRRPEE